MCVRGIIDILHESQQETRSAGARGIRGSFDSPPWTPLDTPYPLQTTRAAALDPGIKLFVCMQKAKRVELQSLKPSPLGKVDRRRRDG